MRKGEVSYLAVCCRKEFRQDFKQLLFDHRLTFGERCLTLTMFTLPAGKWVSQRKIAKKIGASTVRVSTWSKKVSKLYPSLFPKVPRPVQK